MTRKQERFIEEYLVDGSVSAAAERAGVSARYASQLLEDPRIREAIEAREPCRVRRERVLQGLCEVAFSEGSGKLKALELLGKYLGLFEGRPEKIPPVTVVEDV